MKIFYNQRTTLPPAADTTAALAFHRRLPGYTPGPVVELRELALCLGVGRISAKLETNRFGLPAFKALGAFYAAYNALCARCGGEPAWESLDDLRAAFAPLRPLTLLAATDGNHGRAVARFAALVGLEARIFVPANMAPVRMEAIRSEGAELVLVDGSYDDAVARSAAAAGPAALVISDTAWLGYEAVPRDVIAGYSTMLREADEALSSPPDLICVQMGVGALAAAVIGHYRRGKAGPQIVGVEPEGAACVLAALRSGELVEVPGPHRSIMSGLNCGLASPLALPLLAAGLDASIAISDEMARVAMRALASAGVVAGETGAAGLAGLIALMGGLDAVAAQERLNIGPRTHILMIITEGATDPEAYAQIVGHPRVP